MEEFYSQFSSTRLEYELEVVTKRMKIIEKLLNEKIVESKATTSKAIIEHRQPIMAAKALETIAEGKERESISSTASSRNDSSIVENKNDDVEVEPEINTNTNSDDQTDSDEATALPTKIRTRRNESTNVASGYSLRPRNNRLFK